jgi:hypothetical protein
MIYSRSPFAERERQTAGQASPLKSSRDRPDDHFDQRARAASIHSIHSGRKADQPPSVRPPLGRRIVRGLARSVIAVLIGVGGTLAWQCYGDAVKQVAATRAPTLGWLLSYLPTKVPVITASANPAQQRSTSGLDAPRNSVEQLAARQAQMAQNIAVLQAIVEDIRQKMSFTPASVPILLTQPPAPGSQQKSAARTQAPAVEAAPPPRRPLPAGPLSISR